MFKQNQKYYKHSLFLLYMKKGERTFGDKRGIIRKDNKRALSTVVSVLILVALTISAVGIVFVMVNNYLRDQTAKTEKCANLLNKITLNEKYTCFWNKTDNSAPPKPDNPKMFISVHVADVDLDKIIITLNSNTGSKNYEVANGITNTEILNYIPLSIVDNTPLKLGKNNNYIYVVESNKLPVTDEKPLRIKIAPVIKGQICDVSDEFNEIDFCDPTYGFPRIK